MSDDKQNTVDAVPSTIGRYQVTGTLGFGAMGAVYKGYDPLIKRTLAIKTIRLDVPRQSPQHRAFIERFYQEARISGTLSHPNIVTLFDVGEERDLPFLAMEFVDGQTIDAILQAGTRFKPERVIGIVSQVAAALDYAHSKGVIHRDVKPSNLMVYEGDKVKVTDFGIAKLADSEITHSGALLGTPSYMSPEQAMGEKLDGRSDIFSLGVVAFEMLSGQQPFPGPNVTSILYKLVHVDPVQPADLELSGLVPQKWREVFQKVLAKKPENRYPTASAFVQDLEYCLGSWFAGLAGETVSLQMPTLEQTVEQSTLTLPRVPAPPVPTSMPAALDGLPPPVANPNGEKSGAATLVLPASAVNGEETALLPPSPPTEEPAPTIAMSPPAASKTLPPDPTLRPEPTLREAPAAPPVVARPGSRAGGSRWVLGAAAAVVALAVAIVGWAFWPRVRGDRPAESAAPVTEPSALPLAPSPAASPVSGTLRVESEPAGARVRVNGEVRGETPLQLPGLALGAYQVRVDLRGYDPQSRDVTLDGASPSAELRLTLARAAAPASGAADIVSTPAGASVSIDGRPAGATPLSGLTLRPGKRRIEIALAGHETWTGTLDVVAGETGHVDARLSARPTPPAPPTPEPVDTSRVYENVPGTVDSVARKLTGTSPSYPSDRARRLRREERISVVVRFVVTETGEVQDVAVVESAEKTVDEVVVAAVRTWRYQPATKQGVPVKVHMMFKQTFLGG
ncbi:MAG TPA: TonB family protein [Vicinamibacteria bacterium]|nr:TonB family protein [Vicinamibacteria bacterium]